MLRASPSPCRLKLSLPCITRWLCTTYGRRSQRPHASEDARRYTGHPAFRRGGPTVQSPSRRDRVSRRPGSSSTASHAARARSTSAYLLTARRREEPPAARSSGLRPGGAPAVDVAHARRRPRRQAVEVIVPHARERLLVERVDRQDWPGSLEVPASRLRRGRAAE